MLSISYVMISLPWPWPTTYTHQTYVQTTEVVRKENKELVWAFMSPMREGWVSLGITIYITNTNRNMPSSFQNYCRVSHTVYTLQHLSFSLRLAWFWPIACCTRHNKVLYFCLSFSLALNFDFATSDFCSFFDSNKWLCIWSFQEVFSS